MREGGSTLPTGGGNLWDIRAKVLSLGLIGPKTHAFALIHICDRMHH